MLFLTGKFCSRKIFLLAIGSLAGLLSSLPGYAQPGKPDLSFNTSDDGVFGDGPINAGVYAFAQHITTGQIVMGGGFNSFNNTSNWANIVGLTANGAHFIPYNPRPVGRVRVLAPLASGKMYVGGDFTNFVVTGQRYLARVNADGTPDAGFTTGTGPSSTVFCITEQADGKVLLGGNFSTFNGTTVNYITRLTSTGAIDAGFLSGTGANNQVLAMGLQSDGKIIIAGTFTSYNGIPCNRVARLNTDGSFDNSFNIGTGLNNPAIAMQIAPDNKIYLGGLFSLYNGGAANRLLRLNADGSPDNSFNSSQAALNGVETICLQPDGKLVAGGSIDQYNGVAVNRIFRVNTDGSIDPSFNIGTGANTTVRSIFRQSDGSFLVGGDFTFMNGQPRKYFVKLFANGSIDYDYAKLPGANLYVNKVTIQPDEKILVGGRFTALNNVPKQFIGRLNADGTVDNSFDAGISAEAQVYDIKLQSTGKIIYAFQYSAGNGAVQNCLKRLNTDGTEDNTYIMGRVNFAGSITKLLVLPDDKIMLAGDFSSFTTAVAPSVFRGRFARLNADGTIDVGFNPTSPNNPVTEMVVQPDGKTIIFGSFTNIASGKTLVRFNTDGSIDNTFITGTGFAANSISDMAVQADGKILIGGNFTSYNGATHNSIVRLLPDGSVDAGFVTGTGFSGAVSNILLQADGKIILTGTISSYQGVSFTGRAARLNPDGSRDICYNGGTQSNGSIVSMANQNINNIIMVGDFSAVNQVAKHRIVRINTGSCALPVSLLAFNAKPVGKKVALQWITAGEQNSSHFIVERSLDGNSFEPIGNVPAAGNSITHLSYHFTDPLNGQQVNNNNIFYRLQMVDLDAAIKRSETAVVKMNATPTALTLLNNPVKDNIESWYSSQNSSPIYIHLRNAVGISLYRKTIVPVNGMNFIKIPVGHMASGIYYLSITQQSTTSAARVVKTN